jgi:hypothetical protein
MIAWSMDMFVYDPGTNTLEERGEIVPGLGGEVRPLVTGPDGRIYGTGTRGNKVGLYIYDPKLGKVVKDFGAVGPSHPNGAWSRYVMGVDDTHAYIASGMIPAWYLVAVSLETGAEEVLLESPTERVMDIIESGHLFVYDPTQPWTLSKGGPPGHPAPDQADARSNPRYLGDFDKTTRVGLMHSSALGADGSIYFGGFGLRHYTGGGFGWYDPKTEKMDGFWEPLSGYAVQWIAPAMEGRLIVISTIRAADERNDNRAPEEAGLFVYDVSEQKIVREIAPIAKGRTTGLIAEVTPGRLLGLTSNPEHPDRSILYGVDATTGQVLFTKGLPSPVSIDSYWPHWVDPSYEYLAFVRGPDGFVWTYLKDVLVRIDPKDASVHVVGKMDPAGWPTFVGNDVYFSGSEQLRRICNIVPTLQVVKKRLP